MSNDSTVIDLSKITVEDLEAIRQENKKALQSVIDSGHGIDGLAVMSIRFETFLSLFVSEEVRLQFEYAFEARMRENLESTLSNIRRSLLTQGINKASALTIPGR